jgi:glycosyltransferase involved in cell wall biosynthesis
VVAYEDGGVPEMVVDGETGRLSHPGDVSSLTRTILELAGDEALRVRFGEAGMSRMRELFSVERHVARMESVLESTASA